LMAALSRRSRAQAFEPHCDIAVNGDWDADAGTFTSGVDMLLTGKYRTGPWCY
jgi:hypothetical protein